MTGLLVGYAGGSQEDRLLPVAGRHDTLSAVILLVHHYFNP